MSGPVTVTRDPYVSTVTAGDDNGTSSAVGASPLIDQLVVRQRQFAIDDADDGTPAGKAAVKAYVQEQIKNGTFTQADIDRGNNTVPKEVDNRPAPTMTGTSVDCTAIHQGFNLGTRLTQNNTLGNFINDLVAIPGYKQNAVPNQCGLTPAQIVCNLANLCYNVWEPIKARYPNAIITNSLRTGSAIGAGPHGTGQGMDIQFNLSSGVSIPPGDYFAIAQWIRDNIAYDQLLLEYSTARRPTIAWIHAGIYAGTGTKVIPINRVLTLMNHNLTNVGLANLIN